MMVSNAAMVWRLNSFQSSANTPVTMMVSWVSATMPPGAKRRSKRTMTKRKMNPSA